MLTHIADDLSPEAHPVPSQQVATSTPAETPTVPASKRADLTTSLIFKVASVEKTETPGGEQGQDWYRYMLKNHNSTINGLRRGSHQHVCEYAAQYAEQLNTRIVLGPSPWSSRGSKVAPRSR
ncbi:MAG: hypothetical protein HZB57_08540 [Gammaproteobacteria bacterium]|nr:hypothetical protein [Gammaproteobacteria bacterium]